jgi:hypothetical protein
MFIWNVEGLEKGLTPFTTMSKDHIRSRIRGPERLFLIQIHNTVLSCYRTRLDRMKSSVVDPDPQGSALILAVLDPDPYWECGSESRDMEVEKN